MKAKLALAVAIVLGVLLSGGFSRGAFLTDPFVGLDPEGEFLQAGGAWDVFTDPGVPAGGAGNAPDAGLYSRFGTTPTLTLTQTDPDSGAFLTGGGNIYSFSAPTSFLLTASTVSNPADDNEFDLVEHPIRHIAFQVRSLGTELDYAGVRLAYNGGTLLAPSSITELDRIVTGGGFGGVQVDTLFRWDLSEENLTTLDFGISFAAASSSFSLDRAQLDYSAVPEPGTVALLATAALVGGLLFYRRWSARRATR